jgi:glutamyl-tRNA reductase
MRVVLVGTSHHTAPVELRERLSFEGRVGAGLAGELAGDDGEAVALSTCNRTCLYLGHEDPDVAETRAIRALAAISGLGEDELRGALYVKRDDDAARHLFRVAAGLDSLVPGEAQILGQVRAAYETACDADAAGPLLHRLFRQALHAGRRVRHETGISENPASVSSAAAELVASVFGDLSGRRVLVIGAGKAAELTVLNLLSRGAAEPVVANRSPERGRMLAARCGGHFVGLDDLDSELERADVVVASTGSRELVLEVGRVEAAMRRRRGRPIFFVDIAVPRDLDPRINEVDGCYLYDIDDLEQVVEASVAGRLGEAGRAEAIVAEETDAFRAWQRSLDVVPAIASLRALAERIRAAELARAEGRLGPLSEPQRRALESMTSRIVEKLLHLPTVRMKEAAAGAEGADYADAVRYLFGLGEDAS